MNQQNLEMSLSPAHGLVNLLIEVCKMPPNLRRKTIEVEDQDGTLLELPVYVKQGLRCLTILVQLNVGLLAFMSHEFGANHIIEMMEFSQDKEVQANCAKIIRLCLRDDMVSLYTPTFYLVLRTTYNGFFRAG